jgi:hypothetical protein
VSAGQRVPGRGRRIAAASFKESSLTGRSMRGILLEQKIKENGKIGGVVVCLKEGGKREIRDIQLKNKIFAVIIVALISIMYHPISGENQKTDTNDKLRGDAIEYFELIGEDGSAIDKAKMEKTKTSAIFIFSNGCYSCNKNLVFWKKIIAVSRGNVTGYGIIIKDYVKTVNKTNSLKINFKLFQPVDIDRFIDRFSIKNNLSKTILYKDNKVVYEKDGELTVEDYFRIINIIKGG